MITNFTETVRVWHQILKTTNKCYIIACGEATEVALKGKQSGEVKFYCKRCAEELVRTGLFEYIK